MKWVKDAEDGGEYVVILDNVSDLKNLTLDGIFNLEKLAEEIYKLNK